MRFRWRFGISSSLIWLLLLFCTICLSFGFVLVSFAATTRNYEVGTSYSYQYILKVELNEPPPPSQSGKISPSTTATPSSSTVGYKLLANVLLTPVWHSEPEGSILQFSISKPQLQIQSRKAPQPEGYRDHASKLDEATLHPFFVHFKEGIIQRVFRAPDDDLSLVNIKKGIANLFQVNPEKVDEESPLGRCSVEYEKENWRISKKIVNAAGCRIGEGLFGGGGVGGVLGVGRESNVKVELKLSRESAVVEEANVEEQHFLTLNVKRDMGATILSSQNLYLTGYNPSESDAVTASTAMEAINEISKLQKISLLPESILPVPEKTQTCTSDPKLCKPFEALSKHLSPQNMASSQMASAFLQLVRKFRDSKESDIEDILKKETYLLPQLLDAAAASGQMSAHRAVMKVLKFESADEEIENQERYLFALSLSPTTSEEILEELFRLAQKGVKIEKLGQTLVLTIASLAHNLKIFRGDSVYVKVCSEVEEHFIKSLESCKEPTLAQCQQLYLRAFKNLRSRTTLPILIKSVQKFDSKTSVVAMKALHSMPDSYFVNTPELNYRKLFLQIVHQLVRKYDSSVRTLAIDILLRNQPTKKEIQDMMQIFKKTSDKVHAEVATYLWHRLDEYSESNPIILKYLWEIVDQEGFKTYNHLAHRGLSTAFSRVFAATPSGNSSFSNAIEMTGKVLKRSSFDVFMRSREDSLHLLSLGIFAGGLGSFASSAGGGEEETTGAVEDEEPATAGMELTVLGVQLRPIVFFTGKGELMGLVWSGAGSERTTALQGNLLLQDQQQNFPMFNGLVAEMNVQGGLSFDLAGQMQVSLWHRTANSLVENKAGILLQSVISVDTSFVKNKIDYTLGAEAAMFFTSDINFYDGVQMCLKLQQPEFNIKQNIHKTERIPGSKHKLRKAKYKTIPNSGISYALNRKNSQLCSAMLKDEL